MQYLIGVIVALLGLVFYKNQKASSAEALLSNQKEKEDLLASKEKDAISKAELGSEEQKRSDIEQKTKEEADRDPSQDDLQDFFNKPTNH